MGESGGPGLFYTSTFSFKIALVYDLIIPRCLQYSAIQSPPTPPRNRVSRPKSDNPKRGFAFALPLPRTHNLLSLLQIHAQYKHHICTISFLYILLGQLLRASPNSAMRPALMVPRSFSTPRISHCRPRISQPRYIVASKSVRGNASTSREKSEQKENNSSGSSSSNIPSFWTPGRTLLVSAFAAGLGYGVASWNQTQQQPEKGQYGTAKEFEQVRWFKRKIVAYI